MFAEMKTWFPTVIYTCENLLSEEEREAIEKEIYKIDKKIPKEQNNWVSDVKNTQNTYNILKNPVCLKLRSAIESCVSIFAKELGSTGSYTADDSWYNLYEKGDYQEYHLHANSIFSAVYFVTNPPGGGALVFENPNDAMISLKNHTPNPLSFGNCDYNMPANSLIVFRSSLRHCVRRCTNEIPRITIATNLK